MSKDTTIVMVCFETQQIVRTAYESIRKHYPQIKVIIVDGSKARNPCHTYTHNVRSENTAVFHVNFNIGHGEGMHFALKHIHTKYALLMDSDVEIIAPCIELMEAEMSEGLYGVGQVVSVNHHGINKEDGFPYLHPHFALIDVSTYRKYPPSAHHGAPLILPMRKLHENGESNLVKDFPVGDYVLHKGRGTVSTVRRTAYTRGWVK
jgi:hypothetical protein